MKIGVAMSLSIFFASACDSDTRTNYVIPSSQKGIVGQNEKQPESNPNSIQSKPNKSIEGEATKGIEVRTTAQQTAVEPVRVAAVPSSAEAVKAKVIDDPITRYVTNLYSKVLGRAPDAAGLEYWVKTYRDNQLTCTGLVNAFISANVDTNVLVFMPGSSNSTFLNKAYLTFLSRAPDSDGFNFWLKGLEERQYTRETIVDTFINSSEFKTSCMVAGLKAY